MAEKEDIMRLVEAQIIGKVDLAPEEMVEVAVRLVDKINHVTNETENL